MQTFKLKYLFNTTKMRNKCLNITTLVISSAEYLHPKNLKYLKLNIGLFFFI